MKRQSKPRVGERHWCAKLTDAEIEAMRQLREEGLSYGQIARKFEVAKSWVWTVCQYLRR